MRSTVYKYYCFSMCMFNFNTMQSQFLWKHILNFFFDVILRLSLYVFLSHHSLHYLDEIRLLILLVYSGHTLSLFGIHIFIEHHCQAFPFFYPHISTIHSKLFCINPRLFLRSLTSFFNPCISCIVSLKQGCYRA